MLTYLFTKTPLYFFVQSFWRDEAFSYLLASKNVVQILSITAKDFNPPLYYLLLHFWMNIFGTSEIAIRSLSLLFFAFTLYICFDFITQVLHISRLKALVYLSLIIFNPLLNYYAFEGRMYSLIAFFAVLSMYAFWKKQACLYIIATVLGLYTHYFVLFVVLVQGVWILLHFPRHKYVQVLTPLVLSVVAFSPWLIFTLLQQSDNGSFWVPVPKLNDLWYILGTLYTGYEKDFGLRNHNIQGYTNLVKTLNIIVAIIITAGSVFILKMKKRQKPLLYLLLTWTLLPPLLIFLISFMHDSYYLPRYLIFSAIGLVLLVVYLIEQFPIYLQVLSFGLLLFFTLQYQKLNVRYRQKYIFYTMSKQIKAQLKPEDVIYVTDVKDYHVAQYYFGTNRVRIYKVNYNDIPTFVGKVLIPENSVTFHLPPYPSRAFIITYNNGYQILSEL